MSVRENAAKMKLSFPVMAAADSELKNTALRLCIEELLNNKESILEANRIDMDAASSLPGAVIKRLGFDEHKLNDAADGIRQLIKLDNPSGKILFKKELDTGLTLVRQSCPIGVIGVIFEARPDALVQIASLCIKSGNCAILKGGSEALHTNRALFSAIHTAILRAGLPGDSLMQVEARADIGELLSCHEYVDLLIPRGSNEFVRYIMENTSIPVMGHSDGICHIYADRSADTSKAVRIIMDSKTQYCAACNSVETLLVHRDAVPVLMPELARAFRSAGVELRADEYIRSYTGDDTAPASEDDFRTEYLDFIISAKTVDSIDEAVMHINKYGSHHTDCIITEDSDAAEYFMQLVDSAGVYQNCSTRFADGFRYGFGAEVGISTGKLHARGPVGLDGLCTYKYRLYGNGDIVADYAEGRRQFTHRNL